MPKNKKNTQKIDTFAEHLGVSNKQITNIEGVEQPELQYVDDDNLQQNEYFRVSFTDGEGTYHLIGVKEGISSYRAYLESIIEDEINVGKFAKILESDKKSIQKKFPKVLEDLFSTTATYSGLNKKFDINLEFPNELEDYSKDWYDASLKAGKEKVKAVLDEKKVKLEKIQNKFKSDYSAAKTKKERSLIRNKYIKQKDKLNLKLANKMVIDRKAKAKQIAKTVLLVGGSMLTVYGLKEFVGAVGDIAVKNSVDYLERFPTAQAFKTYIQEGITDIAVKIDDYANALYALADSASNSIGLAQAIYRGVGSSLEGLSNWLGDDVAGFKADLNFIYNTGAEISNGVLFAQNTLIPATQGFVNDIRAEVGNFLITNLGESAAKILDARSYIAARRENLDTYGYEMATGDNTYVNIFPNDDSGLGDTQADFFFSDTPTPTGVTPEDVIDLGSSSRYGYQYIIITNTDNPAYMWVDDFFRNNNTFEGPSNIALTALQVGQAYRDLNVLDKLLGDAQIAISNSQTSANNINTYLGAEGSSEGLEGAIADLSSQLETIGIKSSSITEKIGDLNSTTPAAGTIADSIKSAQQDLNSYSDTLKEGGEADSYLYSAKTDLSNLKIQTDTEVRTDGKLTDYSEKLKGTETQKSEVVEKMFDGSDANSPFVTYSLSLGEQAFKNYLGTGSKFVLKTGVNLLKNMGISLIPIVGTYIVLGKGIINGGKAVRSLIKYKPIDKNFIVNSANVTYGQ